MVTAVPDVQISTLGYKIQNMFALKETDLAHRDPFKGHLIFPNFVVLVLLHTFENKRLKIVRDNSKLRLFYQSLRITFIFYQQQS